MSSTPEIPLDLQTLENEMRRLEVEYNMFFAGTRPKPPWDMRARVEAMIQRYDRTPMTNTADRFRFNTLQQRFAAFADLWERGMKAREEGRPSPFASGGGAPPSRATGPGRAAASKTAATEQVLHVTMISDPVSEIDKVQRLYEALANTRRDLGERTVPFHKFADVIRRHVAELHASGGGEVAFRASLKDGKVHLTAKALSYAPGRSGERKNGWGSEDR
jgi:hypothetical protein